MKFLDFVLWSYPWWASFSLGAIFGIWIGPKFCPNGWMDFLDHPSWIFHHWETEPVPDPRGDRYTPLWCRQCGHTKPKE